MAFAQKSIVTIGNLFSCCNGTRVVHYATLFKVGGSKRVECASIFGAALRIASTPPRTPGTPPLTVKLHGKAKHIHIVVRTVVCIAAGVATGGVKLCGAKPCVALSICGAVGAQWK